MRNIRVGFPFVGGEVGGSHISAIKLIRGLNPDRITPVIFLHDENGPLAQYIRDCGLDYVTTSAAVLSARGGTKPAKMAAVCKYLCNTVPVLRSLLKSQRIDIVHTNDGRTHATWSLPAYISGSMHLWHHRGDPDARGVNLIAPLFAHHIVTVSRYARPNRPLLSVDGRLSVIHSPFEHPDSIPDREAARQYVASEVGKPSSTRFLGYFGALIERKRPLLFVEIIHALRRAAPDLNVEGLSFGTARPDRPNIDAEIRQRAQELGIADNIHLMGFRSPIDTYMCAIDALLVPAVNEPFGRTLIELMLLGTPVVATDHGGNPEAIDNGRTGFLVQPESAETFVEPLLALMRNSTIWGEISTAAQSNAKSKYGMHQHISSVTELYERMVAK